MPLLEQIRQMQQQGLSEQEIQQKLKEEGFRPLDVYQALEQSKIKTAVSDEDMMQSQISQQEEAQEYEPLPMSEQMQPSITEQAPEPAEETQEYMYPTPQAYLPEYQPYQAQVETETTVEIAEQIAEEKFRKLKKEIGNIDELKTTTERRIKNIDERLKRIEEIIDRLQASILAKIGNYGQNLQDVKKEMEMMQESFSKTLPLLAKKHHQPSHPHTSQQAEAKEKARKKSKSGIEHYLRR